ncbi:amidohydrolase family protein [Microbacterium soli]|uniref:Amidohydrolase family protein n=2 Tax=Microbacterium soli TaxID=446075 RepID=A0ABP7NDA7_9MICO
MTRRLLRGAQVVDVVNGGVSRYDILVTGDRISEVVPPGSFSSDEDLETIDLDGCWVTPGLIDMHCHLALITGPTPPVSLFLDNGVTGIRDPGGPIAVQSAIRQSVAEGTLDGPKIWLSGEIFDGSPVVWPSASRAVDDPDAARAAVRDQAARGADFVKVYNHITDEVLRAILDEAAKVGIPVVGHVPRSMGMPRAVRAGLRNLEHVRIAARDFLPEEEARVIDPLPVTEREPRLWSRLDVEAPWVDDLIAELVEHDITLDPTLLIDEVVFGDRSIDIDHPDNAFLPEYVRLAWEADSMVTSLVVDPESRRLYDTGRMRVRRFVEKCVAAGVRIVAGTDGVGLGRLLPGFAVHHELALLREAGLSGTQALAAATHQAAHALGAEDLGEIAAGKRADLAVWRVDPTREHLRPEHLRLLLVDGVVRRSDD